MIRSYIYLHCRFVECKDRGNRSNVMLPYSFLPNMAASRLRDAAEKVKEFHLKGKGDGYVLLTPYCLFMTSFG